MDYTTLGASGVKVSRLCMGTMTFGREANEQTSARMFHRCREAGINFFDCANIYAGGRAEEILGGLIKDCRSDLVITSKVGQPVGEAAGERGLSRRHIMQQVETSLKRMGTEWLDVYFCHCFDQAVPLDETLRALDDLVRQGKVRAVGVSNWPAWRIARALGVSERLGIASVSVMQPMYNLAKRTAEVELLPLAQAEGMGVISYSPLGGGLLTGRYSREKKDAAGRLSTHKLYIARYAAGQNYEIAERFTAYATRMGIHPVTLAIAWVKANPAIAAPIIGARSLEQLEPALAAADYRMPPAQWDEIAALTPPVPVATDRDEERAEVARS